MTDPRPAILSVKNKSDKPQSTCMVFLILHGKVTCSRKQDNAQTSTGYKAVPCA